jgi:acetyl esterase/lipase
MRLFIGLFALVATAITNGCTGAQVVNSVAGTAGGVQKDQSYGPLPRHQYDVYSPRVVTDQTPVMLFIHGGSWQYGSKEQYQFVGAAFANAGIQTVVMNYRLYPDVIFPDFMTDAALAVAHVKATVAQNRPLIISGHSAGAHIAAMLAGDPQFLAAVGTDICTSTKAIIGIAGPYTFTPVAPEFRVIFPAETLDASRPLNFTSNRRPPTQLLHGTDDTTVLPIRSTEYATALTAAGNQAEVKLYNGVGHISIVGAISPLVRMSAPTFNDMLSFIDRQRTAGWPGCGG